MLTPPHPPSAPSARYVSAISSHSALHGLSLLSLFIYVYTANASFQIASCRAIDGSYVRSGISYCFSAQMRTDMSHLYVYTYIPIYSILLVSCTVCTVLPLPLYHLSMCVGIDIHAYMYYNYTSTQAFSAHCADIYIICTYILVHYPTSSPPCFLSPFPSLFFLPHSHDLPTDQVYLYDGTQSCQAANFVPFLVLAVLVIFGFVLVAPFLLCLLTKKRWTVSSLHAHCSI